MKAKDIMTKEVKTLKATTKVFEAIDLLLNHRISGAPVVDDQNVLLGIISEKDLLVSFDFLGRKNAEEVQVGEFMTKDVVTYSEETPLDEISQVLVRKNIKRVPIVTNGKVVGVVSRRDVLRGWRDRCNAEKG